MKNRKKRKNRLESVNPKNPRNPENPKKPRGLNFVFIISIYLLKYIKLSQGEAIEYNRCYVWVNEMKVCKTTPRICEANRRVVRRHLY